MIYKEKEFTLVLILLLNDLNGLKINLIYLFGFSYVGLLPIDADIGKTMFSLLGSFKILHHP